MENSLQTSKSPDSGVEAPKPYTKGRCAAELAVVTAALLLMARLLFMAKGVGFIGKILPVAIAVLFLYGPVAVIWDRRRRIDFLDDGVVSYLKSIRTFLIVALIIFPPYLIAAHFWQLAVNGYTSFSAAGFPDFWRAAMFQILIIALPEEFYFRGYFQSTINLVTQRRWNIFGTRLGWGWLITALVFAFAHSVVYYRWWHFAIFFPALVFGYLRERTGAITAPVLFHAASNLLMDWFARSYIG
ncbi:MAG TPA: myxosortase family intramembrane protease [bacterium]|nr:myxosortase family intramembrane protease [bacterium]HQC50496.1 myxosortase family intramembrane protease [bacterium]HQH80094.1 myxosortase family intramembrane protease [bacterium]